MTERTHALSVPKALGIAAAAALLLSRGKKGAGMTRQKQEPQQEKKSEKEKKLTLSQRLRTLSLPKKIGLAAILLLLVGSSAYFAYDLYKYESTDDAYVQAYSTQIAPKVSGMVTRVLVVENQPVKLGQLLVQIDRKDYLAALSDAEASRSALQAQFENAQSDFERMGKLMHDRAISPQAFDRAKSTFENLESQTKAAEARVEEARLNLDYASVRAPSDGVIGRRSIDAGMYAGAGTALLGFVPNDERWVDANFKETQLRAIVPGRPARVTVDALSGKTFDAVVESISPATGATFTLLPPDNATGNFTKVVQRVPVRIRLKNLTADDLRVLQAGLSAEVEVYKHRDPEQVPERPPAVFAVEDPPQDGTRSAGVAGDVEDSSK
jgi:membrane fusion protein (multidrug efflux system)